MGYQLYCELGLITVRSDGASATVTCPSALRSAHSWNIRMALGCTTFTPSALGITTLRAKPSFSHSRVTPTQFPAAFRYSTRNHPSINGHGCPAAGVQAPAGRGSAVGTPGQLPSNPNPV